MADITVLDGKSNCASPRCKRLARAKRCNRQMCSQCCRQYADACGHSEHDKARQVRHAAHTVAISARQSNSAVLPASDPFRLARPKPVLPPSNLPVPPTPLISSELPELPTLAPTQAVALDGLHFSQATAPTPSTSAITGRLHILPTPAPTQAAEPDTLQFPQATDPTPSTSTTTALPTTPAAVSTPDQDASGPSPLRRLEVPMDPVWKALWDADAAKEATMNKARELRRANERALARSIAIWWWRSDGQPPIRFAVQDIQTWPTFTLSQSEETLTTLGVQDTDTIESYNTDAWWWQAQRVSAVFEIKPGSRAILLLRRAGVTDCPDVD
ncbi:hypothetical protein BV20DRAFT_1050907 [Pilatotrama ljubarskyi]|nr:hypothetical protein BV20DRAFT_1050907 [Pilatotrama ljubarskyi]